MTMKLHFIIQQSTTLAKSYDVSLLNTYTWVFDSYYAIDWYIFCDLNQYILIHLNEHASILLTAEAFN